MTHNAAVQLSDYIPRHAVCCVLLWVCWGYDVPDGPHAEEHRLTAYMCLVTDVLYMTLCWKPKTVITNPAEAPTWHPRKEGYSGGPP